MNTGKTMASSTVATPYLTDRVRRCVRRMVCIVSGDKSSFVDVTDRLLGCDLALCDTGPSVLSRVDEQSSWAVCSRRLGLSREHWFGRYRLRTGHRYSQGHHRR